MYGKPSPQGAGNGWSGWYKSWFFRSLKELSYVINVLEKQDKKWSSAEHIKIEYEFNGVKRTYRPDFLIEDKILVEIKPEKLKSTPLVTAKKIAAERYCLEHNMTYSLIDCSKISKEQIRLLYDSKIIKFTDRYNKMYQEYLNEI